MSTQLSFADESLIQSYIRVLSLPNKESHKGNNGKVLVVGGSSLFHGAVLWSAEIASHIVDMVHVASTKENNEIIRAIKIAWQSGMVIPQKDIPLYAKEDDVLLIGNGMMRWDTEKPQLRTVKEKSWDQILTISNEGEFTHACVHYLMNHFPDKRFVFDAGALQMMEKEWLTTLHVKAVLTPHQKEFMTLFGIDVRTMDLEEKVQVVEEMATKYNCIILLKAIDDIATDGKKTIVVRGGNAGLTKGGTGDILAGLVAALSVHSDTLTAAVVASYLLKRTADSLFEMKGYWYSVRDIITTLPELFHALSQGSSGV